MATVLGTIAPHALGADFTPQQLYAPLASLAKDEADAAARVKQDKDAQEAKRQEAACLRGLRLRVALSDKLASARSIIDLKALPQRTKDELESVDKKWAEELRVCDGETAGDCLRRGPSTAAQCPTAPKGSAKLGQGTYGMESNLNGLSTGLASDVGNLGSAASLFGGNGVTWETNLLQGLSNFLADRTEQEVISWFFETFSKELCTGKAQQLFPSTCKLIKPAPEKLSQNSPGALFTSALRDDLENLPEAALFLVAGVSCGDDATCASRQRTLQDNLKSAFKKVRDGVPAVEVLAGFGVRVDKSLKDGAEKCTDDTCQPWQLAAYFCRENWGRPRFECTLGIAGTIAANAGDLLDSNGKATDPETWARSIVDDENLLNAISIMWPSLPGSMKEDAGPALVVAANAISRLTQMTRDWQKAPAPTPQETLARAGNTLTVFTEVWLSAAQIARGGPSQIDMVAMSEAKTLLNATSNALRGDYPAAINAVLSTDSITSPQLPPQVVKFANLVAELASAKDAATVQSLLQAQAAPVGSWRLKHKQFTFAVTAMVGVLGGGEVNFGTTTQAGGAAGLAAQLGVDLVWPLGEHAERFGLFVTILDVGQLTWSRITTDVDVSGNKTQTQPQVGFVQVLSPGLYFECGLGRTPLTLLVGASVAPVLRGYTTSPGGTSSEPATTLRFGIGLAVDLTLFPLN